MSHPKAKLPALLAVVGSVFLFSGCGGDEKPSLVVYCAHDAVYSKKILDRFEEETGIAVAAKFDTEATKSLALVEQLIDEKAHPRCDVFWNNELLGTLRLEEKGVLAKYKGDGYKRIPDRFKDPEGHWTGFGARLRVYIVNTNKMAATQKAVEKALQGDLSRFAIAKPLYGTTRTHYTVLWDLKGPKGLKRLHRAWRKRGVREVTGNAQTKDLVAAGECALAWTDSSDYFLAADAGKPVDMVPVRVGEKGQTICIPNTAAMIKGTDQPAAAKKLIDFLLSRKIELALAKGKAGQIPLGPIDEKKLPEAVRRLKKWVDDGYPLTGMDEARRACLKWLKAEYAG